MTGIGTKVIDREYITRFFCHHTNVGEITQKVRMLGLKLRKLADDLSLAFPTEGFEETPVRSIMLLNGTLTSPMNRRFIEGHETRSGSYQD